MNFLYPIKVDVSVFDKSEIEGDEREPVNIRKISLLMEKNESARMEAFEFDLKIDDLEGFEGFDISGNGRMDFMELDRCLAGMIVFDLKKNYSGQHFFWTYTCLPTQTSSLTLDLNYNLAIIIQITNLMKWSDGIPERRRMR